MKLFRGKKTAGKKLKKQKNSRSHSDIVDTRAKVGNDIDFASSEAYKLLRTNLTFSMNNEEGGNVYGVTSSLAGEGKSITAINLATSFTEMDKKVLIIEGDMRKPVFEKYFNVRASKGLSNFLSGQCKLQEVVFKLPKFNDLRFISAGSIPPNPAELLSSKNMKQLIEVMREKFDIIIIDLPPVTVVADATIASQYTDGLILVVRDNYVEKNELKESIRLLTIAGAKVLGMVYNVYDLGNGRYYKQGYKNYGDYKNHKE